MVALLGFSDDGPAPCLVLGLMAGGSLQRRLGASGGGLEPLPPAARLCVLSDVARALAHLHATCGLAHGGNPNPNPNPNPDPNPNPNPTLTLTLTLTKPNL